MRALLAQIRVELLLAIRQGEQLVVSLGIPIGILIFFAKVEVVSTSKFSRTIDFLAPGVLALAVMSSALVSLGIATGFERHYAVLKRLGATPLGRPRLILAKLGAVLATVILQFAALIPIGIALGFHPKVGWHWVALGTIAGVLAFGGLAMLMAGTLRGPLNLAATNAVYLLLLATGGMMVPFDRLPHTVQTVAKGLPAAALTDIFIGALTPGQAVHTGSWITLAAWAIGAPLLAAWRFRWEP
jgi:ABC-2 type transport system permease protein